MHDVHTDARKRGPDGTRQSQLWRLLREHGPMTATAAGEALGITREQARRAMRYLAKRRLVRVDRTITRKHMYSAVGDQPPADRRGKPDGCRNMRGRAAYANMLRNFRRTHPHLIHRPAATELERCWK